VSRADNGEGYVRRILVNSHYGDRRRPWRLDQTKGDPTGDLRVSAFGKHVQDTPPADEDVVDLSGRCGPPVAGPDSGYAEPSTDVILC
jgi:hypothetical protein